MSTKKTSILIDEELLEAAGKALGTETMRDTVEQALREVLRSQARAAEVEALSEMDGLDLADPDVMSKTWRS